ncbi:hypothetical protein [Prosthecochloris sp.]|uniref:AlbA family DNA-binding domain-containing protein n=1 Tax=Prosthecochloris sp. TaxID=290513 RepID=UPI0025DD90C5|nr:hypothetical protein [Prosthecochloris sp.]
MRNNDGGYLLIGFNNESGSPNIQDAPKDVEIRFHIDKIQGYVSKYSSEAFEVSIHYPEKEGEKFVVIEIPSGVKTPVVTKSGLNEDGYDYIRVDKVYVRSLNSNNMVSTTEAKWKDWPQIVEKCFENREADVGRFLRRHLASSSLNDLKGMFSEFFGDELTKNEIDEQSLIDFLDRSKKRFLTVVEERNVELPSHGSMEVAATIIGQIKDFSTDSEFLNLISSSNQSYTGWPVWVDSRSFADRKAMPFVHEGCWEALIVLFENSFHDHLDYWRISPEGRFYLYRGFEDDIGGGDRRPQSGTALDFGLVILRAAESVVVAFDFAKAMGCDENGLMKFAFRWSGLRGRVLSSWANPERHLSYGREAYQDQVLAKLDVPIDTAKGALSGYINKLVNQLFLVFEGFQLAEGVTNAIIRRLLERRL